MDQVLGPLIPIYGFDLGQMPVGDRGDAWRKANGDHFDMLDLPREIEARGRGYDLGRLMFTDTVHPRQTFVRDRARTRRDGVDHLLVSLELTHGFGLETDTRQDVVGVGRVTLFDIARPVTKVALPGRTLCMAISRDFMEEALPGIDLHGVTLNGAGALMAEHIKNLSVHLPHTEQAAAPHIARATVQMLAACALPSAERIERVRPTLAAALVSRAKRYIRDHCRDPELSPDSVARAVNASRTTLYRAFEPEGGVSEFIRGARLDVARAALADPGDLRRIGEIAFDYGFSSEAQFSRAMRAAFGASPSELRADPEGFRSSLSPQIWSVRGWGREMPLTTASEGAGAEIIAWRPRPGVARRQPEQTPQRRAG